MRRSAKYPVGFRWIIRCDIGSLLVANEVVVVRKSKFYTKSVRGRYAVEVESLLTHAIATVSIKSLRKTK